MQINNDTLKKLSSMDDGEFKKIISAAASENGIVAPNLSDSDLARIKSLLGSINAKDPSITKAIDDISKSISKNRLKDETDPKNT